MCVYILVCVNLIKYTIQIYKSTRFKHLNHGAHWAHCQRGRYFLIHSSLTIDKQTAQFGVYGVSWLYLSYVYCRFQHSVCLATHKSLLLHLYSVQVVFACPCQYDKSPRRGFISCFPGSSLVICHRCFSIAASLGKIPKCSWPYSVPEKALYETTEH